MKFGGFLKEIPWFLLSSILGFSASVALGMNVFKEDSAVDINLYDTYLVLEGYEGVWFLISFFVFVTFGFRWYRSKMKNVAAFIILCISGILLVVAVGKWIALIRLIENSVVNLGIDQEGWTLYPPVGTQGQEPNPIWGYISINLQLLQVFLIGFLIYTGYRTGLENSTSKDEL